MDLTILIPCKNDRENLIQVISSIKKKYHNINILVVASSLKDIDENQLKNFSNTNFIFQKKIGYGAAIIEGIEKISTKFFIIHNADGSFETDIIADMYELSSRYNFVFCDRYMKGGSSEDDTIITFVGNKIFSFISKILLKINLSDVLYTHVLCNTNIVKKFHLKQKDFTFCIELPLNVFNKSEKTISIPSKERKRISGTKNVNEFKDGFLILIFIIRKFLFK